MAVAILMEMVLAMIMSEGLEMRFGNACDAVDEGFGI